MLRILAKCGRGVILLSLLSMIVAALQFVVPLYMLSVYNRILQTGSIETLELISLIAAILLFVMGVTEIARSRVLAQMAKYVSEFLNHDVYRAVLSSPASVLGAALQAPNSKTSPNSDQVGARTQALSDLRQLSAFVASGALNTFFDAILTPIFLAALFLLNPLLGWIGIAASLTIFALALLAEVLARRANKKIGQADGQAQSMIERSIGQSDAVASMGIEPNLYAKWERHRSEAIDLSFKNQSIVGVIGGIARAVRLIVQMAVLGVGAWLALTTDGFLAGAIIAASLILGRALAPIDQSISIWRRFVQARASAERLMKIMDAVAALPEPSASPTPQAVVTLRNVTLAFPGQRIPMLQDATLNIHGGQNIGVLGPVGSGKTTLLRALAGLHIPRSGSVLLGATPVNTFTDIQRQREFGYMPQDIQLLPGNLSENISRFSTITDENKALFKAVQDVNATPFIEALENGLGTAYNAGTLSAGQTQLIGLARAIYHDPKLVLLDEPTSNLDQAGKDCISAVLKNRKNDGNITVFVSHDHELLQQADYLLYIAPGLAKFGETSEIMRFIAHHQKQNAQAIAKKAKEIRVG